MVNFHCPCGPCLPHLLVSNAPARHCSSIFSCGCLKNGSTDEPGKIHVWAERVASTTSALAPLSNCVEQHELAASSFIPRDFCQKSDAHPLCLLDFSLFSNCLQFANDHSVPCNPRSVWFLSEPGHVNRFVNDPGCFEKFCPSVIIYCLTL